MLLMGLSILLTTCSALTPATVPTPSPGNVQVVALGQNLPISAQTKIGDRTIDLEVAITRQQQATGLMYRNALAGDRGMLFPFNPPQPVSFWMKNVSIPLDMIFLRNGVVKAIASNVPPCTEEPCPTYGPRTAIDQVLELRGGRAAQLKLKEGDRVNIKFFPARSRP